MPAIVIAVLSFYVVLYGRKTHSTLSFPEDRVPCLASFENMRKRDYRINSTALTITENPTESLAVWETVVFFVVKLVRGMTVKIPKTI